MIGLLAAAIARWCEEWSAVLDPYEPMQPAGVPDLDDPQPDAEPEGS